MLQHQLLLILSLATATLSQQYDIALEGSLCSVNDKCLTLDQLLQTNLQNGKSLTLSFQPGVHLLTQLFIIQNLTQVQMFGKNASVFSLRGENLIDLVDIGKVMIEGLTFIGATLKTINVQNTFISNSHFLGFDNRSNDAAIRYRALLLLEKTTNVTIESTEFRGSIFGTALDIVEVEYVSIENCTFTENQGWNLGGAIHIDSNSAVVAINHSIFSNNKVNYGGAIYIESGNVYVSNSELKNNSVYDLHDAAAGGAIFINSGVLTVCNCNFTENIAYYGGGICMHTGNLVILSSNFTGNIAKTYGGGIYVKLGNVLIQNSTLAYNNAYMYGGGIAVLKGHVALSHSEINNNRVTHYGGGIAVAAGTISVSNHSAFFGNIAGRSGGGIHVRQGNVSVVDTTFVENSVEWQGGAILIDAGTLSISNSVLTYNTAQNNGGGISVLSSGSAFLNYTTLTGNCARYDGGGIVVDSGTLTVVQTTFTANSAKDGGAIHAIEGIIKAASKLTIINNTAVKSGGGMYLRESSLVANSATNLSHNAAKDGGGIYTYQSKIEFNFQSTISSNIADNGGGMYAITSTMKVRSIVVIDSNRAIENGGAFYLQQSSRLYIQKREWEKNINESYVKLTVSNNEAQLGGGIFVDDSTAGSGACKSIAKVAGSLSSGVVADCFIQTNSLQNSLCFNKCNTVNTFIVNNTATQSGSAIYGGLLDRCTISNTAELALIGGTNFSLPGFEYVKTTVELPSDKLSISSDPLQVKVCSGTFQPNVSVRKGQLLRLNLTAIDQAGNPVNATIRGSVITKSGVGRLKEGQIEQSVGNECTELEYNVFSKDNSAEVELYAIGPCSNFGNSSLKIAVTFLDCTCPLSFHPSQSMIECHCECDEELHVSKCFPEEETYNWILASG